MQTAGYAVVVSGDGERAHPPGLLASLAQAAGVTVVGEGSSHVAALRSEDAGGLLRVRIASGAVDAPPVRAAGLARPEVSVLVAPLSLDEAARAARATGEYQVIVATGEGGRTPGYRALDAGRVVISTGLHGQFLLDVRIALEGRRPVSIMPRFVPLDDSIPAALIGRRILEVYQARLRGERLVERTPRLPAPQGRQYLGPDACKACHAKAHASWLASRHARSFASLQKDGRGFDPDCVRCHVTGFPVQSGYAGRSAEEPLANVGCEACHGPGSQHAADPAVRMPGKAGEACITCHDAEHSPRYDPESYLARIRHW